MDFITSSLQKHTSIFNKSFKHLEIWYKLFHLTGFFFFLQNNDTSIYRPTTFISNTINSKTIFVLDAIYIKQKNNIIPY